MFVWERPGKVWVTENNQKQLLLDISQEVGGYRDFGLLGFALHPQFETNGYFYLLYTVDRHHLLHYGTSNYSATTNEYYKATIGRLTRYTATKTTSGYNVNPASRKVLIGATKSTGIPSLHESHGVGSLVFGTDGTLLISAGDGASYSSDDVGSAAESYFTQALADGIITNQENVGAFRSQLLESYNGKILRIDPETGNGVPSNPFYNSAKPGAVRSKVWASGFRNPFRMVLKPNSGSFNPADGKPGAIYVGDVGYSTWEELDVVTKPGMNFGWPLFEGLTQHNGYWNKKTFNQHAPNPAYGTNGCTQAYFYFQDLIKQEMASGTGSFTNPCNMAQNVASATVKTFLHSRPLIDWRHYNATSRTGTFSGETATVSNIGAAGSPVSGPQFAGNAATVGVFYPHNDFPAEYRNTLFFGDYVSQWIRNLTVDGNNKPVAVQNFISGGAIVVAMATHPTENGLYYINFPSEIRKVTYNSINRAPIAVASTNKTYGPSPLNVQFTGSSSQDPDGQPLSYLWNFGDGTTSTLANPAHSFTTATKAPVNYTVTLTVRDNQGGSNATSLSISLNNTPPQVNITSPALHTLYPITGQTVYDLRATVTDLEHSGNQLSYAWQTTLHHEDHQHPEPIITTSEASTTISPLGCGAETYYYRITLTVTDAAGLATTKEVKLYPDCNIRPTIALTAPTAAASLTAPANITITANSADTDGTISKVEFFNGTTKLGEDATAPYAFNWTNVAAGTYSLTAKATDNAGATTTSEAIKITVKTPIAPIVALTSPAANTSFTAPATISINANATDADNSIAKVEFFNGSTKVGEDATAPYTFNWMNVTPGTYALTAKATDNTGLVTTSAPISVNVKAALAPTVTLTAPTQALTFTAPATVTITANAADPDGTVAKVEFYSGTTKLGEDLTSPYSFAWNNVAAGTYSLTAKATDNSDLVTTSSAVNVTVKVPAAPTIAITAPTANASFTAPATLTLSAAATDADGTITKVEFFNGSIKLGEDVTAPFNFSWSNVVAGSYKLTAKATDNTGLTTTSAPISVNVKAASAPMVAITAPVANTSLTAPASIMIAANATDTDGTIVKVEFYSGTTKLGEDLTSPYNYSWRNVAAGTYSLTAKATDNTGLITTSASLVISVKAPVAPVVAIKAPTAATSFTAPATISIAATATDADADGTISKVEFFNGTAKLGEDLSSPYSFNWNNVASGTYSLTAKATDNTGLITTSATVNVIVKAPAAPTVALTSPAANSDFKAPATIAINANAADADGTIVKVAFYNGNTKLGEDLTSPYSYNWSNVTAGTYTLTAKATDNSGLITTSASLVLTVKAPAAPVVAITAPTAATSLTAPATVTISATATDADGTISMVEFFNGTTKLGEDATAPYAYNWVNVPAGTYSLSAKATDNTGANTTSTVVAITVKPSAEPALSVVSFTLIDADTEQPIQTLTNGATLNLATLGTKKLNIRAETNSSSAGSVVFNLTGTVTQNTTDDAAPYTLFNKNGNGNNQGNSKGNNAFWMPKEGNYTLKAEPYAAKGGKGTSGMDLAINFTVVKKVKATSARLAVKSTPAEEFTEPLELSVNSFPNPFAHEFTLQVQGKGNDKLPVKIFDVAGKLVLLLEDVPNGQPLTLGKNLSAGVYTLFIGTGHKAKQYKLVKTN